MSGDHNMNQKVTGTLFSISQIDAIESNWRDKCQRYIDIHDAVVKDNDRLMALLHRCETEMRYAGWAHQQADQPARTQVYKDVVRALK
jgi:hypothetical protein